MDLCLRVRRWREAAGMSQTELARAVKVTPSAVCQWESDEYDHGPNMKHLEAIAEACGVTLLEFLGEMPSKSKAG